MSSLKLFLAAASVAALCGSAFAEPTPGQDQHDWQKPNPEQMAAWHAQMCNNIYASQAGRLAYLQASLTITDAQRGAFDHWRDEKLESAKAHSQNCLAHTPGQGHEHDALARNEHEQKRLEMRLAELKSERPALEALYQSLTPDQKKIFDHAGHGFGHHHGHHMGERFGQDRGEGPHAPG